MIFNIAELDLSWLHFSCGENFWGISDGPKFLLLSFENFKNMIF